MNDEISQDNPILDIKTLQKLYPELDCFEILFTLYPKVFDLIKEVVYYMNNTYWKYPRDFKAAYVELCIAGSIYGNNFDKIHEILEKTKKYKKLVSIYFTKELYKGEKHYYCSKLHIIIRP